MPVPGVAKPQIVERAATCDVPVVVASGTAVNVYEYPLAGSVVAKVTPVIPPSTSTLPAALALMLAGVMTTGADWVWLCRMSDEMVEVLVGVVEPFVHADGPRSGRTIVHLHIGDDVLVDRALLVPLKPEQLCPSSTLRCARRLEW